MPAPPSSRPADARRRVSLALGVVFGILIAVGIAGLLLTGWGKAERLRDWNTSCAAWAVRDGQILTLQDQGADFVVAATPLRWGGERILYREPLAEKRRTILKLTGHGVDLVEYSAPGVPAYSRTLPAFARNIVGSIGEEARENTPHSAFLPPETPSPLAPDEKRAAKPLHVYSLDSAPFFRRIVFGREPPGATDPIPVPFQKVPGWAVTDDRLYWVEAGADTYQEVIGPTPSDPQIYITRRAEYPAKATLYTRPLTGGPPQVIGTGLVSLPSVSLFADETGVWMTQPRAYPDTRWDLYHFTPDGKPPTVIPDYAPSQMPPVVCSGRLWWMEYQPIVRPRPNPTGPTSTGATQILTARVHSCHLDGSDRSVLSLTRDADGRAICNPHVFAANNRLYLIYARIDESVVDGIKTSTTRYLLARFQPDSPTPVRPPVTIPESAAQNLDDSHLDDGWLYYVINEERPNLLDVLSDKSTGSHAAAVLYRVRLPE